jgi:hypothetical protein
MFIWGKANAKLMNVNYNLSIENDNLPILLSSALKRELLRSNYLKESKIFHENI